MNLYRFPYATGRVPRERGLVEQQEQRTVCGAGLECESKCPVMMLGRLCPSVDEFLDQMIMAGITAPVLPAFAR